MGQKLDEIIKQTNKRFGEEIITHGLSEYDYKRIPFTSPRMNYCTYGGIPVGKITEFFGEEHGGKTTTALDIVSNYQKSDDGRSVLYVDAENTLDAEWATKLGVDVDNLYLLQPKAQSAEDIFQIIEDAVDTGEVGLWVLDSIGVLVSSLEMDEKKTYEDKVYGGISLPLTRFSKKIEMLMKRHNCTGIGINQIRDNLASMYGGISTPGGKAWRHGCSVRMQFSRGKYLDEKGNELNKSADAPAGNIVLMSMVKNKTCPPSRRTGFYSLNYEDGIDYLKDLIDVAIRIDVIRKSGAWFDIVDPETGEIIQGRIHGQAAVREFLEENEEVLMQVEKFVENFIKKD